MARALVVQHVEVDAPALVALRRNDER